MSTVLQGSKRRISCVIQLDKPTVGFRLSPVDVLETPLNDAAKIVGASAHFELAGPCRIRTAPASETMVGRPQLPYLEITHPRADRGAAVLDIPPTEIGVLGDGGNEMAIFESAQVRQAADWVALSNNDPGFDEAAMRLAPAGVRSRAASAAAQGGRHP